MGFNIQNATRGMLQGVQRDYAADAKQQREYARMDHLANTQMAKDKELYSFKKSAEKEASDAQYIVDEGRAKQKESDKFTLTEERKRADEARVEKDNIKRALASGHKEGTPEYNQIVYGVGANAEQKGTAEAKGTISKANTLFDSLYPDMDKDSEEGQEKLRQLMGVAKAEQGLKAADKVDLNNKAKDIARKQVDANGIPPNWTGTPEQYESGLAASIYAKSVMEVSPKAKKSGEITDGDIRKLASMPKAERERMISTLSEKKQKRVRDRLTMASSTTTDGVKPKEEIMPTQALTPQQKAKEMYPEAQDLSPGGMLKGIGNWATQEGKKSPEGSIGGLGI